MSAVVVQGGTNKVITLDEGGSITVGGSSQTITVGHGGGDTEGLAAHEADTTDVHGITDTSDLVLTDDARLSDERVPTDASVTAEKFGVQPYIWWQHSTAQSIPDSTWTSLVWDTHRSQTHDDFTISGQPTRIAFPLDGLYAAVCQMAFAANAAGVRKARFLQGPYPVAQNTIDAYGGSSPNDLQVAMQPAGLAGGYFEIQVWQNSGGALDCVVDGLQAPSLMMCFLSGLGS